MVRVFVRFLYRYRVRAMYGHLIISPIYCDRGTIIFSGMIMVYEISRLSLLAGEIIRDFHLYISHSAYEVSLVIVQSRTMKLTFYA